MRRLLTATLVCSLAIPTAALADILVLNDGTRLEGRVETLPSTQERVAFISGAGRVEFPTSRVREIIEEADEVDWTRIGEQFLDRRNYTSALEHFQKALEANADHEPAREGLEAAQSAIDSQQEERNRELRARLSRELESVPELISLEKFREAEAILDKVLTAETTEEQRLAARRLTRDLFLAWGFSRYDRLDRRGAEEKYQRVLEMDPENEQAREALLQIWRDDPSKRAEVLKAYQAKLEEEPNNLEYNRIVGELLYEFQRYEEAIPHLTKVSSAPAYRGRGYDRRLVNAYEETINKLTDSGEIDAAIGRYRELIQVRPNTDTTNLTMLEYRRDRQKLAEDDWDGRALLINRLLEVGLTRTAEEEAELILRYDPENEVATGILRDMAEEHVGRIQQTFNDRQYRVAINMGDRFMRTNQRFPELRTQVEEIMNKAQIQAERDARANREIARDVAQRGVDAYNDALRNVELMQRTDIRAGSAQTVSYKQRATELARRSIEYMETALNMDPSLGELTSMDLNTSLRDARALHRSLTERPRPLPRARNL